MYLNGVFLTSVKLSLSPRSRVEVVKDDSFVTATARDIREKGLRLRLWQSCRLKPSRFLRDVIFMAAARVNLAGSWTMIWFIGERTNERRKENGGGEGGKWKRDVGVPLFV